MEILEPMPTATKALRVVACTRPFTTDRIDLVVPAGQSIATIMQELQIPSWAFARVFLDDQMIPNPYWSRVRPKAGHILTIRVIPTGGEGSGKNTLRIVAMVAVLALAISAPYLAGLAVPAWGTAAGGIFAAGSTGAGLLTAGIGIVGSLRVNGLIASSMPKLPMVTEQSR